MDIMIIDPANKQFYILCTWDCHGINVARALDFFRFITVYDILVINVYFPPSSPLSTVFIITMFAFVVAVVEWSCVDYVVVFEKSEKSDIQMSIKYVW